MKGEIGIIFTCFVVGSICCLKHKQTTGGKLKESFNIVQLNDRKGYKPHRFEVQLQSRTSRLCCSCLPLAYFLTRNFASFF